MHVRGLGTLLRHLLELLDGDLERVYQQSGLNYRPKYTPVLQALLRRGPSPVQDIASDAAITHSAASQTVSEMARNGLVHLEPGRDARQRIVHLTPATQALLPKLRAIWSATAEAASALDSELPMPLAPVLTAAIDALEQRPFADRIQAAAHAHKTTRKVRAHA